MKIQCKNCLPKEGIELPEFSSAEKEYYMKVKEESPIRAVKKLIDEKKLSHRDAKYIVTHINIEYGQCNQCSFNKLDEEYRKCPKCGALNFNWIRINSEK
jgi:Zn finger protein HypA/HybF involved in hydrogenase expression